MAVRIRDALFGRKFTVLQLPEFRASWQLVLKPMIFLQTVDYCDIRGITASIRLDVSLPVSFGGQPDEDWNPLAIIDREVRVERGPAPFRYLNTHCSSTGQLRHEQ